MGRVPVYIVAGGRSSRFGQDKARAQLDGMPLIVRLAHTVASVAEDVTVVADVPGKYEDLGLRTIVDRTPGLGPLGGLHAALADCYPGKWLLLLSCDLTGVQTEWVRRLLDYAAADANAVAFRDDRWQPLLALYHLSIVPLVERQIAQGRLAMWELLDSVEAVAAPTPNNWHELRNVNTPEDLTGRG